MFISYLKLKEQLDHSTQTGSGLREVGNLRQILGECKN